jgi:hypothetical protein
MDGILIKLAKEKSKMKMLAKLITAIFVFITSEFSQTYLSGVILTDST